MFAEMGSVNPLFLLPGVLATQGEQIAEGVHQSIALGNGQFCTKPGLIFTDGSEPFQRRLIELARQTKPGCMLHAGIASAFAESVKRMRTNSRVETLVAPVDDPTAAATGMYLFKTSATALLDDGDLASEMFGPAALLVQYSNCYEMLATARSLPGQLTASIHADEVELESASDFIEILSERAGRLVVNQFPTGVEVGHAMVHGGPYPATTNSSSTSVGANAIRRFARPVCFQNFPDAALPAALASGKSARDSSLCGWGSRCERSSDRPQSRTRIKEHAYCDARQPDDRPELAARRAGRA